MLDLGVRALAGTAIIKPSIYLGLAYLCTLSEAIQYIVNYVILVGYIFTIKIHLNSLEGYEQIRVSVLFGGLFTYLYLRYKYNTLFTIFVAISCNGSFIDLFNLINSDSSTTNLKVNRVCGKYHLTEEIGRGSFGVVYRAVDLKTKQPVIVKAIQMGIRDERKIRKEADILKHLDHPGIPKVLDDFRVGTCYFIVFPNINSVNSAEAVIGPPPVMLSLDETRLFGAALLDIIIHLQSQNTVHADIKPENVIVNLDTGSIQLVDFGSARRYQRAAELFSGGVGTERYSAPEVCKFDGVFTTKVDYFTLGTSMYRLLTRMHPSVDGIEKSKVLEIPQYQVDADYMNFVKLIYALTNHISFLRLDNPDRIKAHPFFDGTDWPNVNQIRPFAARIGAIARPQPPPVAAAPDNITYSPNKHIKFLVETILHFGGGYVIMITCRYIYRYTHETDAIHDGREGDLVVPQTNVTDGHGEGQAQPAENDVVTVDRTDQSVPAEEPPGIPKVFWIVAILALVFLVAAVCFFIIMM